MGALVLACSLAVQVVGLLDKHPLVHRNRLEWVRPTQVEPDFGSSPTTGDLVLGCRPAVQDVELRGIHPLVR